MSPQAIPTYIPQLCSFRENTIIIYYNECIVSYLLEIGAYANSKIIS